MMKRLTRSNTKNYTCPSDRQLSLRAKIGTGWSFHSNRSDYNESLNRDELQQINHVVKKNEEFEESEKKRIGLLVDRMEHLKKLAGGNGATECLLCGLNFTETGYRPKICRDCGKSACNDCSDSHKTLKQDSLFLCKICNNKRELWKRSGAWFFQSLPEYTLPEMDNQLASYSHNTWTRLKRPYSGDQFSTSMDTNSPRITVNGGSVCRATIKSESSPHPNSTPHNNSNQNFTKVRTLLHHKPNFSSVASSSSDVTSENSSDTVDTGTATTVSARVVHHPSVRSNPFQEQDLPHYETDKLPEGSRGILNFSVLYRPDLNELHVQIVSATNLIAMDMNGLSDPYVKCHLLPDASRRTKLRTTTIKNTLEPVWNELMIYRGILKAELQQCILRITVYDEDFMGSDFLGEYRLPLLSIEQMRTLCYSVPLQPRSYEDIHLTTEFGRIEVALMYEVPEQLLTIEIVQCAHLKSRNPRNYCDPYVKLYLLPDPKKKTKRKTEVKKRTMNPYINEKFEYHLSAKDAQDRVLNISVWDSSTKNEIIGEVTFGSHMKGERKAFWMDVFERHGVRYQRWFELVGF